MRSNQEGPSELSDTQRDLLQSAVRNGYFKVPREVSTIELAKKNEMSSREASEEIHRALDVVLREADLGE
ncbi:helix-turn-helix domain-containing protein [Halanaeroarchaeum sulfurireducens]|uniref:Bacterio-opsin activator HTH domain protein n=1 Tax=Halanaeroarchaeum sulfurireducens TaxID=1604004 RepID=A0A0F7P8X3_9EURY|nr:bacterio-opsin activator HTH domain protein [Halanaeroarchaeum sulfurireducens]ALG82022.1 bacterio-opsin activator HTH domain protein [Halanaeroarchaeum sulfurireducens]